LKTITLIGGSGFVGKSYIDSFNRGVLKDLKVKRINIICRRPSLLLKEKLNFKNINIIRGNISKLKTLPKSDLYIYSAEKANLSNIINFKSFLFNSQKAINNFCNLIKKNKNNKVLYISSGVVYKYNKSDLIKNNSLTGEKLYAYLKFYCEEKIKNLKKYNIKTSTARCFAFIGKWLPRDQHFAIGNFINDGLLNKSIKVKSRVKTFRSYMHSDDLIYWLTKIGFNSKLNTNIFDVGSDKPIEIKQLARMISKIFRKKISFRKINPKITDKYLPDIRKAKKELGLTLTYNLKKSILLTINHINE
jgi:nucleoside-diphosphate-sugar epimerase